MPTVPNTNTLTNTTLAAATAATILAANTATRRVAISNPTGSAITVTFLGMTVPTAAIGLSIPAGQTLILSFDDFPGITLGLQGFSTPGGGVSVIASTIVQ